MKIASKKLTTLLSVSAIAFSSSAVMAQDLSITVTNLTQGLHFTPIVTSAHSSDNHIFMSGTTATAELQAMAEGGDISGLVSLLSNIDANTNENPAAGLLAPGLSTTFTLTNDSTNTHLSLAAMILPSNDGFVGLDSWKIPTEAGTYTINLNAYDAGTEANNELVNGGAAPGVLGIPAAPGGDAGTNGTGVTDTESNTTIHIHRGNLGDEMADGGKSDLNSSIHRWLNPVAKLTITVQ
ncbi:spondin domain-containing protein [Colwellia sp. 6_MG-2023]|uniref:spondin domain-containing protein n=1 Tax=Colwellia sp. 6_MG-2023 TaxID=3062676 RepID=UPI0026E18D44|nr:spondin domain-containing protein [Colwellia sp. 6_MG-2023]MDO6486691.1 spondin domain-containing protein [Colwellia sp. 6_MG-2023]